MATRERPVDRGSRLGRAALHRLGAELRAERTAGGLSIDRVAAAVGLSNAEVSRIERGLAPKVPLLILFRIASTVGLDLAAKTYPGPTRLRDQAQVELLTDFATLLHPTLRWATEVPLPIPGDQRAWDGLLAGPYWRYGAEAESVPSDAQALTRRLNLKVRDGEVDGVLLLMRDTRRVRALFRSAAPELLAAFPVPGRIALPRLQAGVDPGGSSVIFVPRPHRLAPRV